MFPMLKCIIYLNALLMNGLGFECTQLRLDGDLLRWNILDLVEKKHDLWPNGVVGKHHYVFRVSRTESFEFTISLSENKTFGENVTFTQYAEKRSRFMQDKYVLKFEVSPAYVRQDVEGKINQFHELRTIFQHLVKGRASAYEEIDPMFYASEDHHAFWLSWTDPSVNCSDDDVLGHRKKQKTCYQKIAFGVGDIISQNTMYEHSFPFNLSIDIQQAVIHGFPKYNISVCNNSVNYQSSVRMNISETDFGKPHFPTDFLMSPANPVVGYDCIPVAHIHETNNYFCWKTGFVYPGVKWSSKGVVSGMNCTQIVEPSDLNPYLNNYLCFPPNNNVHFTWSHEGELDGHSCIQWIKAGNDSSWNNNFLCTLHPDAIFPTDFKWSYLDVPEGFECIATVNDHLCWRSDRNNPGVRWSSAGSIDGMYCTQVLELVNSRTCHDNSYLCVPRNSELRLFWWREEKCISDSETNNKNLLCATVPPSIAPTQSPTKLPTESPSQMPTSSPTTSPTSLPTTSPTQSPTESPSEGPSQMPTSSPTTSPTVLPTTSPTQSPTKSPTESPSQLPSTPPTESPSNVPSSNPTISPTNFPTTFPSESPTVSPTDSPTTQPSSLPTIKPSVPPTESPTEAPTNVPSTQPTESPTYIPSQIPTILPTQSPSVVPTNSPTTLPTESPTVVPSNTPTQSPTMQPSGIPTTAPTVFPTEVPTETPSNVPTESPTLSPTEVPSVKPTQIPTTSPTTSPTVPPTTTPTQSPTNSPTAGPSQYPSTPPTESPTTLPSNYPTVSPTNFPTTLPSELPTLSPTDSPTTQPSSLPTTSPSTPPTESPTEAPSNLPSAQPTESPTNIPSQIPTTLPTPGPSVVPTNIPTTLPTEYPTLVPSTSPTTAPTSSPTEVPTETPSNLPSESPTLSPTEIPSVRPTHIPSTSPTTSPTDSPTIEPSPHPTIRENKAFALVGSSENFLLLICLSVGVFCLICFYTVCRVRRTRKKRTIREVMASFDDILGGKESSLPIPEFPETIGHLISDDKGYFSNVPKTDALEMQTYFTPEGEPSLI